jgi:hypothetical protein
MVTARKGSELEACATLGNRTEADGNQKEVMRHVADPGTPTGHFAMAK